ncbi:SCO family protein [Sphingobium sufflavum]|uniref:SCO family protein n=1 Tax=Sphingobium sufflavum TaxID=1129547 RepID=UPI001F4592D7|nr:SCO family protein [Sphingobium sufflavum]MCE7795058.1 SCO family protein [Sphingobium sufflavum]
MAGRAMNKACQAVLSIALTLSLPTLSACGPGAGADNAANAGEGPLAGARIGGDFTLTDQDGKPAHWSDYKGKYRLVYFGYTYCPDVCPVDLQKIIGGLRRFEKQDGARSAKVQPVFISVDPGRDTPALIKPWVAAFHPRLIGLTGTAEQIEAVKKSFAVVSGIEGDAKAKDYLVSHTRTPYFFGPDGDPIALVPVDEPGTDADEGSPDAVAAFLNQWVK